jgi:hemerythrin superfamily protein
MTAQTRTQGEDVIAILLQQHQRVKGLMADIRSADGQHKRQAFDELRALLAAHETAEEMVLRPVTRSVGDAEVAEARNAEEDEANHVLAELEKLDPAGAEFDATFATFEQAVLRHAEKEEREEFPRVRQNSSPDRLAALGKALLAAEKIAPTHPHPGAAGSSTAQWTVGPFASLVDRARKAVTEATSS